MKGREANMISKLRNPRIHTNIPIGGNSKEAHQISPFSITTLLLDWITIA